MGFVLRLVAILCLAALADPCGPAKAQTASRLPALAAAVAAASWSPIAPGIERLATAGGALELQAYRLAPAAVRMRVVPALAPTGSSASEISAATHAALVINGGFFWITSKNALAPTGLLIADGKTLAPRKTCKACAGVVYADSKGVHIGREAALKGTRGIEAAVQVGPMLVEQGAVITFKPNGPEAARSAVCLDARHNIIVVAALSALTLFELAALLLVPAKDGGFGCTVALNLDGGPSTQLAVDVPGHGEHLGMPRPVQNFLAFELR